MRLLHARPDHVRARLHPGGPHRLGEEIRESMSGNLCRCGCYVNIVRAVEQAAAASEEA